MKKTKSFIIVAAMLVCGMLSINAQVVSAPVLEGIQSSSLVTQYSQWINAIDQLYANYDMVRNTITNIENQYKQIQQAVERAKSIDWNNIRFDGDFDIRNDIRDANRRVNRLLTQARTIKNCLHTNVIKVPGVPGGGYSLADLCGTGDEDKDVFTAAADVYGYMTKNMQAAANSVTKGITPQQQTAIMAKYGISPANYWFAKQTENQLQTAVSNAMAWMTEEATKMEAEQDDAMSNTIIEAAMETQDENGNMTEGAAGQATVLMLHRLSSQTSELKTVLRQMVGLSAVKLNDDLKKQETEASETLKQKQVEDYVNSSVPGGFATKSESKR